jgi:hypothetical protein
MQSRKRRVTVSGETGFNCQHVELSIIFSFHPATLTMSIQENKTHDQSPSSAPESDDSQATVIQLDEKFLPVAFHMLPLTKALLTRACRLLESFLLTFEDPHPARYDPFVTDLTHPHTLEPSTEFVDLVLDDLAPGESQELPHDFDATVSVIVQVFALLCQCVDADVLPQVVDPATELQFKQIIIRMMLLLAVPYDKKWCEPFRLFRGLRSVLRGLLAGKDVRLHAEHLLMSRVYCSREPHLMRRSSPLHPDEIYMMSMSTAFQGYLSLLLLKPLNNWHWFNFRQHQDAVWLRKKWEGEGTWIRDVIDTRLSILREPTDATSTTKQPDLKSDDETSVSTTSTSTSPKRRCLNDRTFVCSPVVSSPGVGFVCSPVASSCTLPFAPAYPNPNPNTKKAETR